jgi:DNA-binding PadR family transcriptional regulator
MNAVGWHVTNISAKEAKALDLLLVEGELTGGGLVSYSHGVLKLGSVYAMLSRMEKNGLLESRQEANPAAPELPRRFYRVTDAGAKALALWRQAQ